MNPFRRRLTPRPRLGRGPLRDAGVVADAAEQLGLDLLVCEHRGDARRQAASSAMDLATSRALELVLGVAASARHEPSDLVISIDGGRVDLRLIVAGAAGALRDRSTRRTLAEIADWAEAFDGQVALLVNERGSLWLRVSLAVTSGEPPRDLVAPQLLSEWEPADIPAGPLFGSGSGVL